MYINKLRQKLPLLLMLVVSGCAIWGPNYSDPHLATPSSWAHSNASTLNKDLTIDPWWNEFHDSHLNKLIGLALDNNNNIQQAIGNITQAQGALEQVEFAWVPQISAVPGYTSSGGPNAIAANNGGISGYTAGLVPSYSLNILQQLRSTQAAKANLMASQQAKNSVRLTVISQIAGSYFTLLELNYQLVWQKQLIDDTNSLYQLAKSQYSDGYISLLRLQTYEQNYQVALANEPTIVKNIVSTENAIKVLINQNPGHVESSNNFIAINTNGIIPINAPSSVLKQRPDVLVAQQQLIAANANIGVATSIFFPSISLTGGLGSASTALSGLFANGSNYWSSQINANMPILNLAAFGQIKSAKGAYYAAYYNYVQVVRSAFANVDNSLATYAAAKNTYADTLDAYNSANTQYNLSVDNFKDGLYSKLQELSNKVNLDNQALSLASSKLQQLQSIVGVYQSMAGGYNVNNKSQPKKFGNSHDL